MTNRTTASPTMESFVQEMTERMTRLARALGEWTRSEPRTLTDMEQHVMRTIKDLGAALLTGLGHLALPAAPPAAVPCACGQIARFVRLRPATVTTLLGPITLQRPYYHCASCHHGTLPLDQQLGLCAGSFSDGLSELLALLGATQDSFAAAATVLQKLTLVTVAPNSIRAATHDLGMVLEHVEDQIVATAQADCTLPPVRQPPAPTMYVSMDGLLVHLHHDGWSEAKLGSIYHTTTQRCITPPRSDVARTQTPPSFVRWDRALRFPSAMLRRLAVACGPKPRGAAWWRPPARL
jgi:hypothetical protein